MATAGTYVQFGCGLTTPPDWINFDASPTLRMQRLPLIGPLFKAIKPVFPANARFGDAAAGLPVAPNSCQAIYCSHVLEHLSLADFRACLKNTFHYLEPGGYFRLVLPDLELSIQRYLAHSGPAPSVAFMQDTMLGAEARPRGAGQILRQWLGNSRHLWMWDYKSLASELASAGFTGIRRASFGDSPCSAFRSVEAQDRWETALGMECVKPGA
jgi:hypothetical protein